MKKITQVSAFLLVFFGALFLAGCSHSSGGDGYGYEDDPAAGIMTKNTAKAIFEYQEAGDEITIVKFKSNAALKAYLGFGARAISATFDTFVFNKIEAKTIKGIGAGAFTPSGTDNDITQITELSAVQLPEKLERIEGNAFSGLTVRVVLLIPVEVFTRLTTTLSDAFAVISADTTPVRYTPPPTNSGLGETVEIAGVQVYMRNGTKYTGPDYTYNAYNNNSPSSPIKKADNNNYSAVITNGRLSLTLTAPLWSTVADSTLNEIITDSSGAVVVSPSNVKVARFGDQEFHNTVENNDCLVKCVDTTDIANDDIHDSFVEYWYADKNATVKGTYVDSGTTVTHDVTLRQGWNTVVWYSSPTPGFKNAAPGPQYKWFRYKPNSGSSSSTLP